MGTKSSREVGFKPWISRHSLNNRKMSNKAAEKPVASTSSSLSMLALKAMVAQQKASGKREKPISRNPTSGTSVSH
jgi:hypothetical protein